MTFPPLSTSLWMPSFVTVAERELLTLAPPSFTEYATTLGADADRERTGFGTGVKRYDDTLNIT